MSLVKELVGNIKGTSTPSRSLVPDRLLKVLEDDDIQEIGKFLISVRVEGLQLSRDFEKVKTYQDAFDKVKHSEEESEKVYYSLEFVKLLNKITEPVVNRIFNVNFKA